MASRCAEKLAYARKLAYPSEPVNRNCLGDLERLAERQVDPAAAGKRIIAIGERRNAMKRQARWSAPYNDIAVFEPHPARPVLSRFGPEQKYRG